MSKENETKNNSKPMAYDTLLGAVTCGNCGTKGNYRHVTVDKIDYIETERERICNNCNELMDYWAYGHWQSNCP